MFATRELGLFSFPFLSACSCFPALLRLPSSSVSFAVCKRCRPSLLTPGNSSRVTKDACQPDRTASLGPLGGKLSERFGKMTTVTSFARAIFGDLLSDVGGRRDPSLPRLGARHLSRSPFQLIELIGAKAQSPSRRRAPFRRPNASSSHAQ